MSVRVWVGSFVEDIMTTDFAKWQNNIKLLLYELSLGTVVPQAKDQGECLEVDEVLAVDHGPGLQQCPKIIKSSK